MHTGYLDLDDFRFKSDASGTLGAVQCLWSFGEISLGLDGSDGLDLGGSDG